METSKICPQCGGNIVNKKGTSKKTGKPYSFWGCSNYPDCKYIEQSSREESKPAMNGMALMFDDIMLRFNKLDEANKVINDNIKLLHKKVDKLLEQKDGQKETANNPAE